MLVRGAWAPAAAVSLSSLQPDQSVWLRDSVNGRRLQHEEGRSDGDQRREDRHRFGEDCHRFGRGEDICVRREHWQLNRH